MSTGQQSTEAAMLKAEPDGNTIAFGPSNMLVEAPQVMKVPYDPLKDITTIGRVAFTSYVMVTGASYPAQDFQGLVAHLKTRKGQSSFASYGTGTVSQYSGLIFSNGADLGLQHVGYLGSPPALQAVKRFTSAANAIAGSCPARSTACRGRAWRSAWCCSRTRTPAAWW